MYSGSIPLAASIKTVNSWWLVVNGGETIFNFERLDVWNEARSFAHSVYKLTAKINKRYASAAQQLERAALSVVLNIAEGAGRKSKADFQRFIKISNGSINETVTLLLFFKEEGQITQK